MRAIDYEDAIIEASRVYREAAVKKVRELRSRQMGLAFKSEEK